MTTHSTAEGFKSSMELWKMSVDTDSKYFWVIWGSYSEICARICMIRVRLCLGTSCRLMPALSLNTAGSGSPVTSYLVLTCSIALYILRLWIFFLKLSSKSQGVLDISSAKCNVSVYSDIQLCESISSTNGNYANTCALPWAPSKDHSGFRVI